MEIRELQTDFIGTGEVKDFKFHQILSSDKGYIYEVNTFPNRQPYYEVFRRVLTYGIMYDKENGKRVVDKSRMSVSYSKCRRFGIDAWTCSDKERAFEVYEKKVRNYVPSASEVEDVDG